MDLFDGSYFAEWLNSEVYFFFTDFSAYLIKKLTISYLAFVNWAIPFSWGIAKVIITDLQLSASINAALSGMNSETLQMINFFRFPEAINSIATAGMTKVVMRFIPGL